MNWPLLQLENLPVLNIAKMILSTLLFDMRPRKCRQRKLTENSMAKKHKYKKTPKNNKNIIGQKRYNEKKKKKYKR